jgi:hypothetical protein
MSVELTVTIILAFVAVGSLVVNAMQGRMNGLLGKARDQRDQKDIEIKGRAQDNADDVQVLSVAKVNIEMLEKQNELLTRQLELNTAQGEQRETDWRKREAEWRREKLNFETRVSDVEKQYKSLVKQVNEIGVCLRFETCDDYKPAGRRTTVDTKVGGTE